MAQQPRPHAWSNTNSTHLCRLNESVTAGSASGRILRGCFSLSRDAFGGTISTPSAFQPIHVFVFWICQSLPGWVLSAALPDADSSSSCVKPCRRTKAGESLLIVWTVPSDRRRPFSRHQTCPTRTWESRSLASHVPTQSSRPAVFEADLHSSGTFSGTFRAAHPSMNL